MSSPIFDIRYVDDILTILPRSNISEVTETFNSHDSEQLTTVYL